MLQLHTTEYILIFNLGHPAGKYFALDYFDAWLSE